MHVQVAVHCEVLASQTEPAAQSVFDVQPGSHDERLVEAFRRGEDIHRQEELCREFSVSCSAARS